MDNEPTPTPDPKVEAWKNQKLTLLRASIQMAMKLVSEVSEIEAEDRSHWSKDKNA